MKERKDICQNVYSLLKTEGKPMHFQAILDELKNSHEDITSSALGSVLYENDMFVDFADDGWGIKPWLINDVKFRFHPSQKEIAGGYLRINNELVLFFSKEPGEITLVDVNMGENTNSDELRDELNNERKFLAKLNPANRRIEGLGEYFKEKSVEKGYDIIFHVLDYEKGLYGVVAESPKEKDVKAVKALNKKIADLAFELFPDDGYEMLSIIMRSIILKTDLKGKYPPDRLPLILEDDMRFIKDPDYGLFELSGKPSMLLSMLTDGGNARRIIEKHRDPQKALKEIMGGEIKFDDQEEANKFLEQFMALWNMVKAANENRPR